MRTRCATKPANVEGTSERNPPPSIRSHDQNVYHRVRSRLELLLAMQQTDSVLIYYLGLFDGRLVKNGRENRDLTRPRGGGVSK